MALVWPNMVSSGQGLQSPSAQIDWCCGSDPLVYFADLADYTFSSQSAFSICAQVQLRGASRACATAVHNGIHSQYWILGNRVPSRDGSTSTDDSVLVSQVSTFEISNHFELQVQNQLSTFLYSFVCWHQYWICENNVK